MSRLSTAQRRALQDAGVTPGGLHSLAIAAHGEAAGMYFSHQYPGRYYQRRTIQALVDAGYLAVMPQAVLITTAGWAALDGR